jgi:hypothetical protein
VIDWCGLTERDQTKVMDGTLVRVLAWCADLLAQLRSQER